MVLSAVCSKDGGDASQGAGRWEGASKTELRAEDFDWYVPIGMVKT